MPRQLKSLSWRYVTKPPIGPTFDSIDVLVVVILSTMSRRSRFSKAARKAALSASLGSTVSSHNAGTVQIAGCSGVSLSSSSGTTTTTRTKFSLVLPLMTMPGNLLKFDTSSGIGSASRSD
jgi:hypothetical protein